MVYKIGAHEFNIIKVNKLDDSESISKKSKNAIGAVEWEKNTIIIVNEIAGTRKQYTLLHQILYILDYESGIGLSEKQTKALGGCLYNQFNSELSQLLKEILETSEQFNGTYVLTD